MNAAPTAGAVPGIDPEDRLAWRLRHRERLPWAAIATSFNEPVTKVRRRATRYESVTAANAAAAQLALF